PDAGEIGLLVRGTRHRTARLRRRRCCREDDCGDDQQVLKADRTGTDPTANKARRAHHFTSTAGALPPSPVPTGGPKNIFWPFGSVISRECAHAVPSRACHPVTVTRSPAFIVTSRF